LPEAKARRQWRWGALAREDSMTAGNKKMSAKLSGELFEDIPVLKRKWQAALKPGQTMPLRGRDARQPRSSRRSHRGHEE
jgi:hypothetical protein